MVQETVAANRLDRIEEKIDKLSEAMISIARAEEKLVAMEAKYSHQYERLNRFSEKLDTLTLKVEENSRTTAIFQKAFWVIFAAAVSSIVANIYMMG
jgi:anti-sigma-K factor RskA